MEKRSPRVIIATLKRHSGVFALKKHAGLGPQVRSDEQSPPNRYTSEPVEEKSGERTRPISRWRQSLSDLQIAAKLKQVVGVKRSREDDDETMIDGDRPRKAPAIEPAFWSRYRTLRYKRHEIEAMVEASTIAHAYDETHGYVQKREIPAENKHALAALEGRTSRNSSFSFAGDDRADFQYREHLADSTRSSNVSLPRLYDFSWAGDEVDDFRCYVKAASQGWEVH